MTQSSRDRHFTTLMYEALAEPIGLVVEVGSDRAAARQLFYRLRTKDPLLQRLQIRFWGRGTELALCKGPEVLRSEATGQGVAVEPEAIR